MEGHFAHEYFASLSWGLVVALLVLELIRLRSASQSLDSPLFTLWIFLLGISLVGLMASDRQFGLTIANVLDERTAELLRRLRQTNEALIGSTILGSLTATVRFLGSRGLQKKWSSVLQWIPMLAAALGWILTLFVSHATFSVRESTAGMIQPMSPNDPVQDDIVDDVTRQPFLPEGDDTPQD
jgi:hypothetical protein